MKFGKKLDEAKFSSWKREYIDYSKLKNLLKQDEPEEEWSENDESSFVEELDRQLEKVYSFQSKTYEALVAEVSRLVDELKIITNGQNQVPVDVKKIVDALDSVTEEVKELEKYSRLNFTGFFKIAKKHDKTHVRYTVRPLLIVRLAACPFNKENFSPLLLQLSKMYAAIRKHLGEEGASETASTLPSNIGPEFDIPSAINKVSHKFWVHSDNIMEVKTFILRRLPVLVYTPSEEKVFNFAPDPTITTLYLDNSAFELYMSKVEHKEHASAIYLQWYGNLKSQTEVQVQRETTTGEGDSDYVEERFAIKEKHVQEFLSGSNVMEKRAQKMRESIGMQHSADNFETLVKSIQSDIIGKKLTPVLRATYTRTAFQVPGENNIKVTLDTDIAMIREDCLDYGMPCRNKGEWHRKDIDDQDQTYPYAHIKKGEINRFPYGLLEIKVERKAGKEEPPWVQELTDSYLVKAAPRFSKYAHGVATLFDNYVNLLPFWLTDMEKDIRQHPEDACDMSQAGDVDSPSIYPPKMVYEAKSNVLRSADPRNRTGKQRITRIDEQEEEETQELQYGTAFDITHLRHVFMPGPSGRRQSIDLPPGVHKPGKLIKDSGSLKVETKVWLANERTFIKWMHIAFLLTTLSLALYNGARTDSGRFIGGAYAVISIVIALWAYLIYNKRANMIRSRSPEHFDDIYQPIFVCLLLMFALFINFVWKWQEVMASTDIHLNLTLLPTT